MTTVLETEKSVQLSRVKNVSILIVEDNLISRTFLEAQISGEGHQVLHAENGMEAISMLKEDPKSVDVILMDREMPVMDGLTAVKRIKSDARLSNIPVIMITGNDTDQAVEDGLSAGVFYYLTKPVKEEMLRSVLSAAVRDVHKHESVQTELSKHQAGFELMTSFRFEVKTLGEANRLSGFIANCFPDPSKAVPGISELLINAIEHGNLELGYEAKAILLEENRWLAEIRRRAALPEFSQRTAIVSVVKNADGIHLVIEDEGKGFDWKKYVRIDPSRAGDSHGRGIALAAMSSFDKLQYSAKGNKVIASSLSEKRLDW